MEVEYTLACPSYHVSNGSILFFIQPTHRVYCVIIFPCLRFEHLKKKWFPTMDYLMLYNVIISDVDTKLSLMPRWVFDKCLCKQLFLFVVVMHSLTIKQWRKCCDFWMEQIEVESKLYFLSKQFLILKFQEMDFHPKNLCKQVIEYKIIWVTSVEYRKWAQNRTTSCRHDFIVIQHPICSCERTL